MCACKRVRQFEYVRELERLSLCECGVCVCGVCVCGVCGVCVCVCVCE